MTSRQRVIAPLIYVDSDVYIDLITRNETVSQLTGNPRWKDALEVFDAVNERRVRLATSALIEAEVGCNEKADAASQSIRDRLGGWFNSPETIRTDVDSFLARESIELSKRCAPLRAGPRRMRGGDATHLAAAVRLGCDFFFTHDKGFPLDHTIDRVAVSNPHVVWQETLFDGIRGAESA